MNKYILLVAVFLLSACDSSYSVSDFTGNHELMEKWVIKCQKVTNPSDTIIDNCQNLQKAQMQELDKATDDIIKNMGKNDINQRN
ncbi:EexN family lipoprotein [Klebsiella pneumoniae]|nr:EexN family lipoprotein [Klebsiella pneumoniae]ELT5799266.1 EexN family lipoprotein [Klebsiella pneumoniae]HDU8875045.1 EexN family lipoprotein [Escherichia coli]